MNRAENRTADQIDRKSTRSARFNELDRMAQAAVAVPFANAADALTFLRLVVGHAFTRLTGFDTRHQTRAFFGSLASGDDFRALAKSLAWADREWGLLTKPANDRDPK